MERSARKRKPSKSIEQLKREINQRNPTEIGITGKKVPVRKMSSAKRYKFEKERTNTIGKNVGGIKYDSGTTPYLNPHSVREGKTFFQFMEDANSRL